jgi:catechol 2,3-dioxygenase-like lactoylglutathione lyase family enzyme
MNIERIGQIAIPVKDLDRAVDFYRDVVGLKFLFRVPNLAFFDCGGVRIMLDLPENEEHAHASSILYFSVADLQSAHEELKAKGAEIASEPHLIARLADREVWMSFFRDPDSNMHALMSEVPLK